MKYDAFISYSHSADGRLAPALQSGLQRLARPWYRRRALRVFRDETGLTVNPHLWSSIAAAMGESRYFVLMASPDAAVSPWVNREVEHWVAHHPPETLLPVLTAGELVWSEALGDFDPALSTSLPPAARGLFHEEPRHLDLRWARDEEDLDLRHSRFRGQVATLAATIHGVERDDLEGEDIRQHRRAMRLAIGAAITMLVLFLLALGTAGLAVRYAATARDRQREADLYAVRAARNEQTALYQRSRARLSATEASRQFRRAQAKSIEAARSAQEAEANAAAATSAEALAQENAATAAARAADARRASEEAIRNATRATQNALLAERNAVLAAESARRAQAVAEELARSNEQLAATTRTALSRQLAAMAGNDVSRLPDRAMLEAAAAQAVASTPDAVAGLTRVLASQANLDRMLYPETPTEAVALSPNGRTVASLGTGGSFTTQAQAAFAPTTEIDLLDRVTGQTVAHRTLVATSPFLSTVRFLQTGQLLLDTVESVDTNDGQQLRYRALLLDGETLDTNEVIRDPDPGDGAEIRDPVLSPDAQWMAIRTHRLGILDDKPAFVDWRIELWHLGRTPTLETEIVLGDTAVAQVAVGSDGMLAWAEPKWTVPDNPDDPTDPTDYDVYVRDPKGHTTGPLYVPVPAKQVRLGVNPIRLVPYGERGVVAALTDVVHVWDAESGRATAVVASPGDGRVVNAISADLTTAAFASQDLQLDSTDNPPIVFVDVATGTEVGRGLIEGAWRNGSFSPDGDRFVIGNGQGDVAAFAPRRTVGSMGELLATYDDEVALSAGGTGAITFDKNGGVAIVDPETGRITERIRSAGRVLQWVHVADGGVAALWAEYGTKSQDGTSQPWQRSDGYLVWDHDRGPRRIAGPDCYPGQSIDSPCLGTISPDGRIAAFTPAPAPEPLLWDTRTGTPLASQPDLPRGTTVRDVLWRPGGGAVLVLDGAAGLTNLSWWEPGRATDPFAINVEGLRGPAFSRDGSTFSAVVGGTTNTTIQVWSTTDWSLRRSLPAPEIGVSQPAAALSNHGRLLATGVGTTVRLWNVDTGDVVPVALQGTGVSVDWLGFEADGDVRAFGYRADATARGLFRWRLNSDTLVDRACRIANRELSREEWLRLVGDAVDPVPVCAGRGGGG